MVMTRSPDSIPEDPVGSWKAWYQLNRWVKWLRSQSGWTVANPRGLLLKQIQRGCSYRILDMLQKYVDQQKLRKKSKEKIYSTVQSYFAIAVRHRRIFVRG